MQQVTTSPAPLSTLAEEDLAVDSISPSRGRLAGSAGVIVLAAAIAGPVLLQKYATYDPALVITFGYAVVFFFGVLGSITFFLPVPTMSLVFAGSTILNPVLLALAAAAGITVGMAGCYALGKTGSKLAERSQPDPSTRLYRVTVRVANWYSRNVTVTSFLVAALPNPVFDYAGYFAGMTNVDEKRFLAATFAGKVVQALVIAMLGYYAFEQISRVW